MAFANLVGQICADKEEFVQRFRDFMCKRNGTYDYSTDGVGWTLIDSDYTVDEDNLTVNDWWVMYSPGEDGDQDLYFKCTYVTNYIKISGYLSWDSATSTGSAINYSIASNFYSLEATPNVYLSIHADLDFIFASWQGTLGYSYSFMAGRLMPGYADIDDTVLHTTGAVTAGSDKVITLDDTLPSTWEVGSEVYIRTTHTSPISTTYIEKVEITAISGQTITADLVNPYTSGSAVTSHVGYFCQDSNQFLSTTKCLILPTGVADNQTCAVAYFSTLTLSYFDPESFENRYMLYDFAMSSTTGLIGIIPHLKKTANHIGDLTVGSVITAGSVDYRCYYSYSAQYFAVEEV